MRIFSGNAHPELGKAICERLHLTPGRGIVEKFPDGETKVQILDDVRGLDIFIVQPTCYPQNETLMEMLIMADAIRRASAKRITAVIPYYGYARQDRKHAGRVPITAKLVANLICTAGVDRVLCMDLHATQVQGFFDIPVDHLFAAPLFAAYLKTKQLERPVVMSPDIGSLKMADNYAKRIQGELAVVEKRRVSDTEIETGHVIGNVKDRNVIIVDDMISTGGSMAGAIKVAKQHGAKKVICTATHGLFVPPAIERLEEAGPDEIVVTDTIPQNRYSTKSLRITVLTVADLLAEAIGRIHHNKSVSLLFV